MRRLIQSVKAVCYLRQSGVPALVVMSQVQRDTVTRISVFGDHNHHIEQHFDWQFCLHSAKRVSPPQLTAFIRFCANRYFLRPAPFEFAVVLGVGVPLLAKLLAGTFGTWEPLGWLLGCIMIYICQQERMWLHRELQTGEEGVPRASAEAVGVLLSPAGPGLTRL